MCYYKTDEFMQQSGRIDSQIGKNLRFESSVNSEGIETFKNIYKWLESFESSVNSEGIETSDKSAQAVYLFESSVNSEGIETHKRRRKSLYCLRAV